MESRRKKPDGKRYGLWHQGRHGDMPLLESSKSDMALDGAELYGETSTPLVDTMTFPERRAPLWVALSIASVAALVIGLVVIQTVTGSGGVRQGKPPVAVAVQPDQPTAAPQTARTVRVSVPGPETTVRVRVPAPTVTVAGTPTPVPGPTVTVTKTATPKPSPAKVRPTVTVTVTVTETVTVTPEPTDTGLLPNVLP